MRRSRAALAATHRRHALAQDVIPGKPLGPNQKFAALGWYASPEALFFHMTLCRYGGQRGTGKAKVRGNSAYYKALSVKALAAKRLKRAALDRSTAALRARREAEKAD